MFTFFVDFHYSLQLLFDIIYMQELTYILLCITMSTSREKKKKDFLEKHKPLSKEDIVKGKKDTKKAKEKYAVAMASIEQALTEFMEIKDEIKWNGKTIMLVRRPTMKELQNLIPKGIGAFIENPTNFSEEDAKAYDELFYGNLAKLVVIPKLTAKQWEEKANPWLLKLFFEHMEKIAKVIEGEAEGF